MLSFGSKCWVFPYLGIFRFDTQCYLLQLFIHVQYVTNITASYEGFGLVLLEAMDAGVPLLASRNSAIPEVMGVDYPGLFQTSNAVELADKMIEVMSTQDIQQVSLVFMRNGSILLRRQKCGIQLKTFTSK